MSLTKVDNGDGGARVWASTDPAIKLFGRDIPVASTSIYEPSEEIPTVLNVQPCSQQDVRWEAPNPEEEGEHIELVSNEFGSSSSSNDGCGEVDPIPSQKAVGGLLQNLVRAPLCTETSMAKREDAQGQAAHEKMPKKPVKPVPCPRCESLDTKFCYFNNYNVNQPRHFCRKCQRYWTAGGTLRNVPVGAGRRKNKHSVSHQKHIVVPDTIRVRSDPGDMAHQRCSSAISTPVGIPSNQLKSGYSQHPRLHMLSLEAYAVPSLDSPSTKSTTPSFGQESPLCRSMAATMLNMQGCTAVQNHRKFNGQNISPTDGKVGVEGKLSLEHEPPVQSSISIPTHKSHNAPTVASVKVLSADNLTSGSPVTTHQLVAAAVVSQQDEHKVNAGGDGHAVQAKDAGFSSFGGTWQFGSNMAWNNPFNTGAASNLDRETLTLPPPNLLACNGAPGGLWTSFPWPLINPAMWGPPPLEWTGSWNMPWGPAAAAAAAAVMQNSGLRSTVRKHQLESSQSEGCLWVPKTLRIGDPVDAARSSIWTTLGLGDGPASSPVGGATKAFQIKSETKDRDESTTPKWHTNPAAFSRSAAFNENG